MMAGHFLRIKKLTGKGIVEVAARHNHREIMAELGASHIDPKRAALNRILRGHSTAAGVANEAKALMSKAGVKPLKRTAVMALEIVFSLPQDTNINPDCFFKDAIDWTERHFAVPLISAIAHYDEAAPHCHVLLLPLVEGRMVGSDLMGGRAKLLALHNAFHANVGDKYGMKRQALSQKGYSLSTRRSAARIALDVLLANGALCGTANAIVDELFELIAANPAKLLALMGREMPTERVRTKDTFVEIMTRPSKPESKHGPIGLAGSDHAGLDEPCPIGLTGRTPIGLTKLELIHAKANSKAEITAGDATSEQLPLSCVGNRAPLRLVRQATISSLTQRREQHAAHLSKLLAKEDLTPRRPNLKLV